MMKFGKHAALKMPWAQALEGSSPSLGTCAGAFVPPILIQIKIYGPTLWDLPLVTGTCQIRTGGQFALESLAIKNILSLLKRFLTR